GVELWGTLFTLWHRAEWYPLRLGRYSGNRIVLYKILRTCTATSLSINAPAAAASNFSPATAKQRTTKSVECKPKNSRCKPKNSRSTEKWVSIVVFGSSSLVVFVIRGDPILRDGFLRGANFELPAANQVAHASLQSVLSLGIPFRLDSAARLRP